MSEQWKRGERAILSHERSSLDGLAVIIDQQSCLYPYLWHCKAADGRAESYLLDGDILVCVPAPEVKLDPREPEPVAMKAPSDRPHDGQANTSGVERKPSHLALLAEDLSAAELAAILADVWSLVKVLTPAPEPSTLTVLEGIERWRLEDARNRQVKTTATGHVVMATLTLLDEMADRTIKFLLPYSADQVMVLLDGITAVPPHEDVTMGHFDFKPKET